MPAKPWDRITDEPAQWYARFQKYLAAGPQRTFVDVYRGEPKRRTPKKRPKTVPAGWQTQIKKWRWKERAEAWDVEEADDQMASLEELRLKRRLLNIEMRDSMFDQFKKMANYPLHETIAPGPDGGMVMIKPVKWDKEDVLKFAEAVERMGRLAEGESVSDINVTVREESLPGQMSWLKELSSLATPGGNGSNGSKGNGHKKESDNGD